MTAGTSGAALANTGAPASQLIWPAAIAMLVGVALQLAATRRGRGRARHR